MEERFSALSQSGSGVHPASYTMGTGSFPGVKRPGRGVDHPPPSSAEVKERVELYLYSPSGAFLACYRATFTFTFILYLDISTFQLRMFVLYKSSSVQITDQYPSVQSATGQHTFLYVAIDFFNQSKTMKLLITVALHAAETDTNRLTTFPSFQALWQLSLWSLNEITTNYHLSIVLYCVQTRDNVCDGHTK